MFKNIVLRAILAGILAASVMAFAGPVNAGSTTLYSSTLGDIVFPFTAPKPATSTPGLIDNMTIGATTPRAGNFTTLNSTSAPGGAGITALFAAPPSIGSGTPAAGAFTTLSASGAVSGAGFTALLASPPAIGGTAPAAGAFTTVSTTSLGTLASVKVDTGTKTAAATAGAATLNKNAGVITSEALTTAAGATYVLDITNSTAAVADQVMASVQFGTSTTGTPTVTTVSTATAGHIIVTVQNIHATAALNGTIKVSFVVYKN